MVAAAAVARDGLDGPELGLGSVALLHLERSRVRVLVDEGGGGLWQDAGLEDAATIVSGAVVVEALADDLAALDDNGPMAVVERRQTGLLDAEIEVRIGLHYCDKLEISFLDGQRLFLLGFLVNAMGKEYEYFR